MTNRYEINASGEIIDTANFHRIVATIEKRRDGRRFLGDIEVTHIWNNPQELQKAVERHLALLAAH